LSLKNLDKATGYTRHFFIPKMWQIGSAQNCRVVSRNVIALGRRSELLVFHGFLDFEEKVLFGVEDGAGALT
jgi:hypothetical protein